MNIEHCKAYRLISTQDMKDMGTKGYLLEHNKTKAKVVLMENQDENKVFTIGFRTPPKDCTGVAAHCGTYGIMRFQRVPGKRSVY